MATSQERPGLMTRLAIQSQINAAVTNGSVTDITGPGTHHRHYYCCPWSTIYQVRQPVVIDGQPLRSMEQFTFDVSAEEMGEGGEFTRRLVTGPFHPTTKTDYCDPESGHHDD